MSQPIFELKPCPFCGARAELFQNGSRWAVECSAESPTECQCGPWTHYMDSPETAIEEWNKRADDPENHPVCVGENRLIGADAIWAELDEAIDRLFPFDGVLDESYADALESSMDSHVKHGFWNGDDECSVCKLPWNYLMKANAQDWGYFDPMPPYCPNCGAKMDL